MARVYDAVPFLKAYMLTAVILGTLASGVLFAGGVGLWKMARWGWSLCNGYAIYSLLAGLLGLVINFTCVIPAMREHIPMDTPEGKGAYIGGVIGGMCGSIFGMLFPIVILFVINTGASGRAKHGQRD